MFNGIYLSKNQQSSVGSSASISFVSDNTLALPSDESSSGTFQSLLSNECILNPVLPLLEVNSKAFMCDICGKKFSTKSNCTAHKKSIHNEERRFKCPHCSFRSFKKDNLKKHIPTHWGKIPYSCKFCHSRFSTKVTLKEHVMNKHPSDYQEELLRIQDAAS